MASSTNLPSVLSFKDYVTRATSDCTEAESAPAFTYSEPDELLSKVIPFDELPQEIIERILDFCHPRDLLTLSWSGKQSRAYALQALFGNSAKWFIVHYNVFLRAIDSICHARLDIYITQSSCLLAANRVVNLRFGGAPFNWDIPGDVSLFNNLTVWHKIFTYFPSLEKIAFATKQPLTDREWETVAQFPTHLQIWLEYGSSRNEKLYRLHPQQKSQVQGKLHIIQYIYLPPPTGPLQIFVKFAYSLREVLRPYLLRLGLGGDYDPYIWPRSGYLQTIVKKSLSQQVAQIELRQPNEFNEDSEVLQTLLAEAGRAGTPRRLEFNQRFLRPIVDAYSVYPTGKAPDKSPIFRLMEYIMEIG